MTLLKRLIGVIAVEDGRVVQSLGYRRSLPVGRIECVFENLDRWGVDEVMVVAFDRSRKGLGPDFDLIKRIAELGLGTPLGYGGGVSSVADAVSVVQAGVERICVDSLLHDDPEAVHRIADEVGAQAVIAALPLSVTPDGVRWYDHRRRTESPLSEAVARLLREEVVSEALVVDWRNEGRFGGFDVRVLEWIEQQAPSLQLLAYGGISDADQVAALLERDSVMGVCVGNFLNYREHAVQRLKRDAASSILRPPVFPGYAEQ